MSTIKDFAVNGGLRSWERNPGSLSGRKIRIWTLTVHLKDCRYAQDSNAYANDESMLRALAEDGLVGYTGKRFVRCAWIGCKVCGTATSLTNEEWMQVGESTLAEKREAERLRNAAWERDNDLKNALRDRKEAAALAFNAWVTAYQDEVDAVIAAAEALWDAQHPDKVALIESSLGVAPL
jgi:hypothetical protein